MGYFTKNEKENVSLPVYDSFNQDKGYGRACFDYETFKELSIFPGDYVKIIGKKTTAALVWESNPKDDEPRFIRLDEVTRKNAGIHINDQILVEKIHPDPAESVTVEPVLQSGQKVEFGAGIERLLKKALMKRAVHEDELFIVPGVQLFGDFMTFSIIETNPKGIIKINDDTEIKMSNTNS
jgi:hypothetical protein